MLTKQLHSVQGACFAKELQMHSEHSPGRVQLPKSQAEAELEADRL